MGFLYKAVGVSSFPYKFARYFIENQNFDVMIETGTYTGDNAAKCKSLFDKVYSIEASREYFAMAKAKYGHVKDLFLCFGDSRVELENVCRKEANSKIIFWLDAHYSG